MAIGLCCHLLRVCARKVCGFGFTDYDGNWGEVENGQDDNGGGGRGAVGVAGTWAAGGAGGDDRVGYGGVGNGYGGGGWVGGRGGGGGGGGVNGNWGDAECNDNTAGEYRYDGYGVPAAAAAYPTGPFSPTFCGGNGGNNLHRVTPMNTPASPAGGGGVGGYYHNSRPFSPLALPTSDGMLSPPRIETPTAPAQGDIEDEQLQAAIAASTLRRVAGADDPVLPVAVPVPD